MGLMSKKEAAERINVLRRTINRHRNLYHVLDREEISEAALDSLKHELAELEIEYPDLVTPDSPTQRVGGEPLAGFTQVRHGEPMLSLANAKNEDELRAWHARVVKLAGDAGAAPEALRSRVRTRAARRMASRHRVATCAAGAAARGPARGGQRTRRRSA